ncbi:MAG: hypothetical protein WBG86_15430 [Polyangiales bacterium]
MSTPRAFAFYGLAAALWVSAASGCGTDIVLKDIDEPCTRDGQCIEGLKCLSGVCLVPEDDPEANSDLED